MTGPASWRVRNFASLPSTSDHLIALAQQGEPGGLAILADCQTAGRGSRNRSWSAPPGNLNLSALLRPDGDAADAGRWALLAGVALWDAVTALAPGQPELRLKWPNDLLLDGRKLAGLLVDSALDPSGRLLWVVVGFGVNLAHAPSVPGRRTACLAEAGIAVTPEAFAPVLLDRLSAWAATWRQGGYAAIRDAWLARAHDIGDAMTIQRPGGQTTGCFAGLTESGALLLDVDGTCHAFATGEVFPGALGPGALFPAGASVGAG